MMKPGASLLPCNDLLFHSPPMGHMQRIFLLITHRLEAFNVLGCIRENIAVAVMRELVSLLFEVYPEQVAFEDFFLE